MPSRGILRRVDAQLVQCRAHCRRLPLLKLSDAVEEDFSVKVSGTIRCAALMFVGGQEQLALTTFNLVPNSHPAEARASVDRCGVRIEKIGSDKPRAMGEER